MSNFSDVHINKSERRMMLWDKKKEDAKFYRDLSKLSFGGMIITSFVNIGNGGFDFYSFIIGSLATIFFAYIANNILKIK